jgi:lysozyme
MADNLLASELALELTGDEDLRLVVYDDANGMPLKPGMILRGHPTIGVGRALDVRGITKDEARYLLANDIAEITLQLSQRLSWFSALSMPRQAALANMAFNLGVGGLLEFHNALLAMSTGDFAKASDELLNSKWASQVGARARRIAQQIKTGVAIVRTSNA